MEDEEVELRNELEKQYPNDVYSTDEMTKKFSTIGFAAPYVVVKRKEDNVEGSLQFTHMPRFYYNFKES